MTAAITAAENGMQTVLLEHGERVGKKLLQTGNGKCNYTNRDLRPECYRSETPEAVRHILSRYQTADAVKIPVVGMGGVSSAEDVLEMMMAGAAAVEVGAANLTDPLASKKIIEDLPAAMEKYGIDKLSEI